MNLYSIYDSNPALEEEGINFEVGECTFKLSRAGGANKSFTRFMERELRPYRQQMQRGRMDDKTARKIMANGYSRHICRGWENVTDREGDLIPFSVEAFQTLMLDIPELFEDIIAAATDQSNFVEGDKEETAKT